MVFSSTVFLFAFLPIVLTLYFATRSLWLRNILLVAASLIFYAWGEPVFVGLLLLSILVNHGIGLGIEGAEHDRLRNSLLAVGIMANLLPLAFFKYATFLVGNLDLWIDAEGRLLASLGDVHLPIGISFYTFQAISYLIDVQRGACRAQRSPLRLALYISLFPQLIAGPIVRYRTIAGQLENRPVASPEIMQGIQRFIIGLAKKVLIADTLARPVDAIFALGPGELPPTVAWLGAACFILQIYFDFSGYSDMAIGLGRIFGFRLPENFAHPYAAQSMTDFWRRWHISLMTWLRDYLYLPLVSGRDRGLLRASAGMIVFFFCGLWHGANWNFIAWGLLHGAILELERRSPFRARGSLSSGLAHIYVLIIWMFSMAIFRCQGIEHTTGYLAAMLGTPSSLPLVEPLIRYLDAEIVLVFLVGVVGSTPWPTTFVKGWLGDTAAGRARIDARKHALPLATTVVLVLLLLGSTMALIAGTHDPFIYFRF